MCPWSLLAGCFNQAVSQKKEEKKKRHHSSGLNISRQTTKIRTEMKPQSLGKIRWWEFSGQAQKKFLGEFFFRVPREYTTGWTCPFMLFKCLSGHHNVKCPFALTREEGMGWELQVGSLISRCRKVISRSTKQFLFIKKQCMSGKFYSSALNITH